MESKMEKMGSFCSQCEVPLDLPEHIEGYCCPQCFSKSSSELLGSVYRPWDQRKTLQPPPFRGPMKRILGGLNIGDERVDALPLSAVCCHGGQARKIGLDPHPEWVDWESVRRGQKAFVAHIGQAYTALTFALLQGFSIARFAEVLFHSGYAQSAETAFERYRETSFAIVDWMCHPIDEEGSQAQIALQNIRAMHSFARRRSCKLFDKEKGEGIALSQYDMSEVLLGFAGLAPNVLLNEFGVKLPREVLRDWCHVWRLIGYHLGIKDEFNCCNSLEDMEAIVEEWMPYVPLRFKTCRPSTFELQRTAMEGFGKYTGIGVEFFSGMLHAGTGTRDWGMDIDYIERPCHLGMKIVGLHTLRSIKYLNAPMSRSVLNMRATYKTHPEKVKRILPYLAAFSRLNDAVLWRIVGLIAHHLQSKWKQAIVGWILGFMITRAGYKTVQGTRRLAQRLIGA